MRVAYHVRLDKTIARYTKKAALFTFSQDSILIHTKKSFSFLRTHIVENNAAVCHMHGCFF